MISLANTLFPSFIIMLTNLLKSKNNKGLPDTNSQRDGLLLNNWHLSAVSWGVCVLPEDWVIKKRAGNSIGGSLDGSVCFELPLLLLLRTQLCLWSTVHLLPDLWLQIVRVVSQPSHQEHSANKGHMSCWFKDPQDMNGQIPPNVIY